MIATRNSGESGAQDRDSELSGNSIHDYDAERSVICQMALNTESCKRAAGMLLPADFFDDDLRVSFTVLSQYRDEEPAERQTQWLMRMRDHSVDRRSVAGRLAKLVSDNYHVRSTSHGMDYFMRTLIDKSQRRATLLAAEKLSQAAVRGSGDYLSVVRDDFDAIQRRSLSTQQLQTVGASITEHLEYLVEGKGRETMVPTGIPELDHALSGGWGVGESTIIAGLTGTGKSSLAMASAMAAARSGKSIAFVTMEMSEAEFQTRMIANEAGVDIRCLSEGRLSREGRAATVVAVNAIGGWKFVIHDLGATTVAGIVARLLRQKEEIGVDLVVIDYLQLIQGDNPRAQLSESISGVSRQIKLLAKDFKVPVLCLCQFNREASKESEPKIHHLKGSSSIEQDGDIVLTLTERDREVNEECGEFTTPVRIKAVKVRRGAKFSIDCHFHKRLQRFEAYRPDATQNPFNDYSNDDQDGGFV